jgi:hypothetical protein
LSEEEPVVSHAERWEVMVAVEQKKLLLSRKVAAAVDISRGCPYASHRHEHEPARPAVLELGQDAPPVLELGQDASLALPPVRARRYRTVPRSSTTLPCHASLVLPPHLTHAVAMVVACAVVVAAAVERDTHAGHSRPPPREREREDAQRKDEVTPHTRGEHEKIKTKWTYRT